MPSRLSPGTIGKKIPFYLWGCDYSRCKFRNSASHLAAKKGKPRKKGAIRGGKIAHNWREKYSWWCLWSAWIEPYLKVGEIYLWTCQLVQSIKWLLSLTLKITDLHRHLKKYHIVLTSGTSLSISLYEKTLKPKSSCYNMRVILAVLLTSWYFDIV